MPDGQLWLMVACAVHVPLALAAVLPRAMSEDEERVWTALCRLWLPAAIGLLISFLLPPGTAAVLAATPWFLFAGLVGAFGADFTWRHRRHGPWHEVLLGFAAVYFAGSAVWLLAQRGGWELLGFEEPWVTWTASHFLVLGTSTLVIAAVMGRMFPAAPRHKLMAALLALSLPFTAMGIQMQWIWIERFGAWTSLLGVSWLAVEMLVHRFTLYAWRRRALDLAALSVLVGMGFALCYTLNVWFAWGWPSMTFMADWHAGLNTVGWGILALAAVATRPGGEGDRPPVDS